MTGPCPEERLTAWTVGELDGQAADVVAAHMETCAHCRARHAVLERAWRALDDPLPTPGRASLPIHEVRTIERLAEAIRFGRSSSFGPARRRSGRWMAAIAAAVIGFAGGRMLSTGNDGAAELTRRLLEAEDAVFIAHLESSDALSRLGAVERLGDTRRQDGLIVDALLAALATDPSVNVRLAAVDALTPALGRRDVALRAARLMEMDGSILVQVALAVRLTALQDGTLRSDIVREVEPSKLSPEARRRFVPASLGRT